VKNIGYAAEMFSEMFQITAFGREKNQQKRFTEFWFYN